MWDEQLGELRYWGYLLYYSSNPAWVREEQKEWVRVRLALVHGDTV